ncbi:MAG: M10 family metallopeptidase C-terminal domain-containing protein, partial [Planctomycetota bacterium]
QDGPGSNTGFFIFRGVAQGNGIQLTIDADDLDELFYVASSSVTNEEIRIQASDGTLLSAPALVRVYSARAEATRPTVQIDSASVLGNESILASSFINAFDPDGFPILSYTIRDRAIDQSFFSLDGQTVPQGVFRLYTAEEFERLQYNGVGRRSENIDVFAFDGTVNSNFTTNTISVDANINRPNVQFGSGVSVQDELLPLAEFIQFFDSDGNTLKSFDLKDRNTRSFSGSIVFRGQELAAGEFHTFTADQLDEVFFVGGERSIDEQLRYRVSDGRFRSSFSTILLSNVAAGGGDGDGSVSRPMLEAENFGNNVVEQLFIQSVTDLVTQVDSGFPGTSFQLVDTNPDPVSSVILLDGAEQTANTLLTFTAEEYANLEIRSGTFENRFFDEIYVKTSNGTFDSTWTRINLMTEPEYFEAFTRLTPQGNTVATWNDFIADQDTLTITYSFMQQLPNYNTGEALEEPGRTPTPRLFIPFTDPQREWTRYLLNHIETFADVEFIEVVDSPLTVDPVGGNRGGTIRFANYYRAANFPFIEDGVSGNDPPLDDARNCLFNTFGPSTAPEGGDVWLNIDGALGPLFITDPDDPTISAESNCAYGLDFLNPTDLGPGTFEYREMLTAVAIAMGQGVPFDVVGGGDQNPILPPETSIDVFTQYGGDTSLATNITGYGLYDVNYFQSVYGANNNFNSGDTTYSVSENLNFGANSREVIWDGAGIDTLSALGSTINNPLVDLRPGFFSSIGALQSNISVAFGAQIENALGSNRNDTLIGNELDNRIIGGNGNDILRGNGGDDFLVGGANADTFQFTVADGDNRINEMQLAGRDTIQFLDETGAFGIDDLVEDFSFELEGRDLIVSLTLNNSSQPDTTVRIIDQTRGAFRVETLEFGTTRVDLVNLVDQADGRLQKFQLSSETSVFGNLVIPS